MIAYTDIRVASLHVKSDANFMQYADHSAMAATLSLMCSAVTA